MTVVNVKVEKQINYIMCKGKKKEEEFDACGR